MNLSYKFLSILVYRQLERSPYTFLHYYSKVLLLVTVKTQGTSPAFIQPQKDIDDFLIEDGDTFITVIAAILSAGTLTKETFSTVPNMSQSMDEITRDAEAETDFNSRDLQILREDIEWLKIPFLAVARSNFEVVDFCNKTGMDLEKFCDAKTVTVLGCAVAKTKQP
ncbi:hypothetical protein CHS0354_010418 [Potamilus streckersoni]|uniref:Uncharacterized protein n=1 Tax=Potamilus streckersoni TaxID=2493646 RepID=A0AAE0VGY2_9BIVA|nr:hypothetical protein CHS0354_010418 [Potamilus streckersoni]